jgi:hypothetical protein
VLVSVNKHLYVLLRATVCLACYATNAWCRISLHRAQGFPAADMDFTEAPASSFQGCCYSTNGYHTVCCESLNTPVLDSRACRDVYVIVRGIVDLGFRSPQCCHSAA